MKYEIPSEKTIAMTVMMVTNSEPVYSHMHTSTNVPPAPIIQVSRTKHLLNKVLFNPVQQTLQDWKMSTSQYCDCRKQQYMEQTLRYDTYTRSDNFKSELLSQADICDVLRTSNMLEGTLKHR